MVRPLYCSSTPYIILFVILFGVGFYYLVGGEYSHEIINAIMCATAIGLCFGYASNVLIALSKHPKEFMAEDTMILGVFILAISLAVVFAGLWAYRLLDDEWYRTNAVFFVGRLGAVCGFSLMMTAVHSVNGRLPREAYLRVGKVISIAVVIALIVITIEARYNLYPDIP
jgi:drug/metabolite transporter (DMT)-like permease